MWRYFKTIMTPSTDEGGLSAQGHLAIRRPYVQGSRLLFPLCCAIHTQNKPEDPTFLKSLHTNSESAFLNWPRSSKSSRRLYVGNG